MTEQAPNPEQREQGPEYEVEKLVWLNELTQELYRIAQENRAMANVSYASIDEASRYMPSDGVLDTIQELALAMTRREGIEFGRLLMYKLRERADIRYEEAPDSGEGDQHIVLAEAVDRELFRMGVFEPDEGPEEPGEQ